MLEIANNLDQFNEESLPFQTAFSLTEHAIEKPLQATLIFVSKDEMFRLNNQLRGMNSTTDVLSLPFSDCNGEIYICPDHVFETGFDHHRILHLFVHGLLHLAGFTHDEDIDFQAMSKHEIAICQKLGIGDPYL